MTVTWATDTNFVGLVGAAAPLNGTPTKVAPGTPAQGAIPGRGIGAQHFNYLLNDMQTRTDDAIAALTGFSGIFLRYGTGLDGVLTSAAGDTALTRDMHYSAINISGTARIVTNGFRIFCTGTFTRTGTATVVYTAAVITHGTAPTTPAAGAQPGGNGGVAASIAAIVAGTVGTMATPTSGTAGGAGGGGVGGNAAAGNSLANVTHTILGGTTGGNAAAGGTGGAGSSGAGGTSGTGAGHSGTAVEPSWRLMFCEPGTYRNSGLVGGSATALDTPAVFNRLWGGSSGCPGRGGGAGGGNAGGIDDGSGGGGGGAAGVGGGIIVICARFINWTGTGPVIICDALLPGQNGAAGGAATTASSNGGGGGGAGGGGGRGGTVWLEYDTSLAAMADAISCDGSAGGNGGAGGNATGGAGGFAGNGAAGSTGGAAGVAIVRAAGLWALHFGNNGVAGTAAGTPTTTVGGSGGTGGAGGTLSVAV
jgi:hypothetical protein